MKENTSLLILTKYTLLLQKKKNITIYKILKKKKTLK
jgi:hypothetical protein